ncbi:hypothetical protein LCGC14_2578740, partial [marine sediment metagenome]
RQSANQEAIVNIVRLMAITTAARTAIRIDYTSHGSAIEIMNEITISIDAQLLKLGNDSANADYSNFNITIADPNNYQALRSLRPVIVKSMLEIGASLAKIINFEVPPTTTSSLVLAYEQYEVLNRETVEIWGDGTVVRDYIYIKDLVKIIADLINTIIKTIEKTRLDSDISGRVRGGLSKAGGGRALDHDLMTSSTSSGAYAPWA